MNPFGLSEASLKEIERNFQLKQDLAKNRSAQMFDVFADLTDPEEITALKFLYAYMPLTDFADYSGELFLSHVRYALKAREITPWGRKVSGSHFLHFVLPYRITNETIEDYRPYFMEELLERVKDLSMADAILEVNHWTHEKATYIASDPRTASPLTLVRNAKGRCGEESALLVTALRSLCIPARQCYTPRWAHTDSNHAWVEAWADGEWYFLGACEPEPKLNMGWFSGPARRAMLVHTRIPGNIYDGPELKVQVRDDHTELNLLSNYAPTRDLTVVVRDEQGDVVEGASVDFQVFNFGMFSTIVRRISDAQGEAHITTGHGDLMIFAFNDEGWGYKYAPADSGPVVEVRLSKEQPEEAFELTMTPPPELPDKEVQVTEEEREANNARLKYEDEVRTAYEATFVTEEEARKLAQELGLDEDGTVDVLIKARGNSHHIAQFLKDAAPKYGEWALRILQVVSAKDLGDTTAEVLTDHLEYGLLERGRFSDEDFAAYVLCPRVSLEVMRPYRAFFRSEFSSEMQAEFKDNPAKIVDWIKENIEEVQTGLFRGFPTPRGVYELGLADSHAQEILFVALARSFGIPARLDPMDRKPQYLTEEGWVDARIGSGNVETQAGEEGQAQNAMVRFHRRTAEAGKLEYYRNFTVSRLEGNTFHTLRFRDLDEASFDEKDFSDTLQVRPGYYWLTTGNRLADGSVLVRVQPFHVRANETTTVELVLRTDDKEQAALGRMTDVSFQGFDGEDVAVNAAVWEEDMLLAWIEPDREPTKHLIRELGELKTDYEKRGLSVVLAMGEDKLTDSFDPDSYTNLPRGAVFCLDKDYTALQKVESALGKVFPRSYPIVLAINSQGEVVYSSTGYQIGTGVQVLEHLRRE